MAFTDPFSAPLTAATAAHLLRRATFGPTHDEIASLVGKTAEQAVDILINNSSYRATPPPPVEMEAGRSDSGQPFLTKAYSVQRDSEYYNYIQYWWVGLMTEQNGRPAVLEKLTAFWQNHFVTARAQVADYRFTNRYLTFLRANALGNFRDMAIGITKDPAMLIFLNGNENTKGNPNENYARELQELFTVGQKDFSGNDNYTEEDVKAAARVLTGWQASNRRKDGSTSFDTTFNPDRHDTSTKTFSTKYNSASIQGRSGPTAGDEELKDLVDMLLQHPETPKFICRKLYRWYVNPNVTDEIEQQVIIPLASFFASSGNNFKIAPLLKKLLSSEIFYDVRNIGAIIKSPAELMIGTLRLFNQPVPDITTEYVSFKTMMNYVLSSMNAMQLSFLNQPSVFGSLPYYQTGYSRNWINGTALGLRGSRMDGLVSPSLQIKPGYLLGVDILGKLKAIQPNFANVAASPAITCEQVLAEFSKNLYAVELSQAQRDFLIDKIMMMNSSPRTTWVKEWDAYRAAPTDATKQNTILWRCRTLLRYMLRMAEYQLF
ncbi:DUF1800 domain-containing protein [Dyadobacter fermentans]|uniref:Uncharacterized protein n=1 Tax=Dyadobacter fermentans (strain ATCC 700827 / DSM 18053 / CIP 107007 / KCTC 52180 / NS114) TaxID=471854 RepID=C6VUL0_DYAFD|nr:DUF1800 domain-containing protein [Dyadobacter fermentans]ACT91319.1 Protein of unknown function DUF1800 [Dyadobacter fermentans DSM 18053]